MPDFLPRFHHPEPELYIFLGYSGRGLALSSAIGSELATVLAGAPAESFPVPVSPVRRIPLHRFWRLGVNTRVAYGRLLGDFRPLTVKHSSHHTGSECRSR